MRLSGTKATAIHQYRGLGNQLWDLAGNRPSLDLQFANQKSLVDATTGTNLIDFTRASSGTYVGSDGLIKTATTNLWARSEEFQTTWINTALTINAGATQAPTGALSVDSLIPTTASAIHRIQQSISITSGNVYTASVYAKANGYNYLYLNAQSPFAARATFNLVTGAISAIGSGTASIVSVGNGWYRCSVTGTAGSTQTSGPFFQVNNTQAGATDDTFTGDGTSGIYLWGAQLEQSSTVGEYVKTTNTINSAPRFDHDPTTGESLGLLVEEQRTNLCLQSEDFSTTWGTTNYTVTTNATTAPNGTVTADKLIRNTTDTTTSVTQNVTVTANTAYNYSVFVKASEWSKVGLREGSVSGNYVTFDLSSGTIVSSSVATGAITAFANGWYRISMQMTTGAAQTTYGIRLIPLPNSYTSGTPSYSFAGDGTSGVFAWGGQLEAGSFPTSYIPTTTSAVTRAADVATDTTRGSVLRSLFAQFRSPASGTRPIVSLDDNTANERIELFTSGTDPKLLVTDGGSAQADIDAGAITANTTARLAARFNTDNFAASVSGGAEVLDATGTMPTVDRIRIGRDQAGNYLNGTIARITGWNDPLPMLPPVGG